MLLETKNDYLSKITINIEIEVLLSQNERKPQIK